MDLVWHGRQRRDDGANWKGGFVLIMYAVLVRRVHTWHETVMYRQKGSDCGSHSPLQGGGEMQGGLM